MTRAVDRLEAFLRDRLKVAGTVPLHEPLIEGNEWAYVKECLDTGWVSSAGAFVDRFESELASACGVRAAVATVNGTAALHVALRALGVQTGDAVICPALTFVATANAIAYCGAVPLFADSDPKTIGLSPRAVEAFFGRSCAQRGDRLVHRDTGLKIAAILPVHVFGHPVDMTPMIELGGRYGVPVIEDATEALGSLYDGRPAGSLGTVGVLSFNGNKIMTTGGGGAVLTDDEALARRIRHLSTTARTPGEGQYDHDEVGYNYRLPNLNAALGCAQLEQLPSFVRRKRRLARDYQALFRGCPDAALFVECEWARSNYWLNGLIFLDSGERDRFLDDSGRLGIGTRGCWRLLCDLPMFRDAPRADGLAGARDLQAKLACLPSGAVLAADEVDAAEAATTAVACGTGP